MKAETLGLERASLRAYRVPGDPHDAVLFPQQIKGFGRFLGQADNALRIARPAAVLAFPAHCLYPPSRGRSRKTNRESRPLWLATRTLK